MQELHKMVTYLDKTMKIKGCMARKTFEEKKDFACPVKVVGTHFKDINCKA